LKAGEEAMAKDPRQRPLEIVTATMTRTFASGYADQRLGVL
jgi:hypothetical protein